MNREDFAGLVLDACRRMEERGMTVGTWGNISVRIDSESFLITPSGMSYGCLKTEDIVLADMKALSSTASESRASSTVFTE